MIDAEAIRDRIDAYFDRISDEDLRRALGRGKMDTLKSTPANNLSFIGKVVKKSLEDYDSSWDMTVTGALWLAIISKGNPGMALYMLSVIDPQPGQVITSNDVVDKFPFGFVGDWDTTWDEFKVADPDQRRVFRV